MTTHIARTCLAVAVAAALMVAGCLGGPSSGAGDGDASIFDPVTFKQAGSSTVLPVAQAWAEEFRRVQPNVDFVVGGGGSGAGIAQFCRGELDVADSSRPIKAEEVATCRTGGIEPFEVQVAIDGLAVVVSNKNTFVDHLTVAELHRIWTADEAQQANRWSDLRPDWPEEPIERFGPGTDSGTFDYFIEVIIQPTDGKESKGRSDYTPSEDDNFLVQGVRGSEHALGYFGLAYVKENAELIRSVPIDEGKGAGPVEATNENVATGAYAPLSRPIFMYTDRRPTGALLAYFEFGLGTDGQALVDEVGYIALPPGARIDGLAKLKGG